MALFRRKPPDGPFEIYHDSGHLKYKGTYKDGDWSGPLEDYYENGQLRARSNYKDRKEHGPFEEYHENGALKWQGTHKDGKLHGPSKEYNENGTLWRQGSFNMGKKCGEWVEHRYNKKSYPPCPSTESSPPKIEEPSVPEPEEPRPSKTQDKRAIANELFEKIKTALGVIAGFVAIILFFQGTLVMVVYGIVLVGLAVFIFSSPIWLPFLFLYKKVQEKKKESRREDGN